MQPVNIFTQMPSCAPSAPGLETTGFEITGRGCRGGDAMAGYRRPGRDDELSRVSSTATRRCWPRWRRRMRAGKTVGGHYASPDLGPPFAAYAAGGAGRRPRRHRRSRCHRPRAPGDAQHDAAGSAWYDVESQITAVTEKGLDPRNFILCTDDCHSGTHRQRRPHEPRRPPRHRLRLRSGGRAADGDDQHRDAFRAGARAGLDRAGPAGRHDPDVRP